MQDFHVGLADILEIETSTISSDLDLSTLDWDSLAFVSTIALIDECFGIIVRGQALEKCQTVGDIEQLIQDNQKG
jgi:acyl carrier protein